MSGLWADADEANAASLAQIQKGAILMSQKKAWKDMTTEEQREDIASRTQQKGGQAKVTSYVPCIHDGSKLAFSMYDNTLRFAGAKGSSIKEAPTDTKLIIDLADQVKLNTVAWVKTPYAGLPKLHPALESLKIDPLPAPPILNLNWPDRDAPRCDIDWWRSLLKVLRSDFAGGRIIIACIGSHGRTGTAMAALMLAGSNKLSVEDAIKMVRKVHCPKAVESWDQVDYLCQFRPNEKSDFLDTYAASDSQTSDKWSSGFAHCR